MKQISNADYSSVLRLLESLSRRKGLTVREREDARKAALLTKKLRKKDEREISRTNNQESNGENRRT